jgi:protocatechuate 3,4-dioxygenase beta subunit
MKKIKGVLSLLFLLIVQSSFAQLSINGRVTDSENVPLSGVAIVVKGANIGTTTNEKGEYAIKTQKENSI